jgi:hypothetical protein
MALEIRLKNEELHEDMQYPKLISSDVLTYEYVLIGSVGYPKPPLDMTACGAWQAQDARTSGPPDAGSVSSFLIGSEMIGMSQVRSGAAAYPFADALWADSRRRYDAGYRTP